MTIKCCKWCGEFGIINKLRSSHSIDKTFRCKKPKTVKSRILIRWRGTEDQVALCEEKERIMTMSACDLSCCFDTVCSCDRPTARQTDKLPQHISRFALVFHVRRAVKINFHPLKTTLSEFLRRSSLRQKLEILIYQMVENVWGYFERSDGQTHRIMTAYLLCHIQRHAVETKVINRVKLPHYDTY